MQEYAFFLGNRRKTEANWLDVSDKATGKHFARVAMASSSSIAEALDRVMKGAEAMRRMPIYKRRDALMKAVGLFEKRSEELAQTLCSEAGKPLKDSRGEVGRLIDTFRLAAEEATRIRGEYLPIEISERTEGYESFWKRVPVGPCVFITPFNFPLNLVAHKVAPAIAAGCAFILKPASLTPVGALLVGEVLAECGLPENAFSILPCRREDAQKLLSDERVRKVSFTGSPAVGWEIRKTAYKKNVTLELGGNAACIVDEGTEVSGIIPRLVFGGFYQSGQSCIHLQRLIIHESVYAQVKHALVEQTRKLKIGDPHDEKTDIGPLISEDEAKRVETWVNEALNCGAKLLCGGKREGATYAPTILEGAQESSKVCSQEIFGPVVVLSSFDDIDAALAQVNRSQFGLQAGIFSNRWDVIRKAWDELDVGGIIVGDVPSWRSDAMPYGGVKESGMGREGVRFAIEEMTEPRLLVYKR